MLTKIIRGLRFYYEREYFINNIKISNHIKQYKGIAAGIIFVNFKSE